MAIRNVLKYPGSKWRIAHQLVELIPEHHSYLEPYFGSGAVFFKKQPSAIETINDMDNDVVNLFKCIRNDPERLARIIATIPYARQVYDEQYENIRYENEYEATAGFLIKCWQGHGFRTNRYRAGWKNDVQGRERAYALYNWYRLPEWIINITERLREVQIDNRPAVEVIKRFDYEKVFMYIDPPYPLDTRSGKQYKFEMSEADHVELLQVINQSKAKIMISSYDNDLYNNFLRGGGYGGNNNLTATKKVAREQLKPCG